MEQLQSGISLYSRLGISSQLRAKPNPSSTLTSKAQDNQSTLGLDSRDQSQTFELTRELQKSIGVIEAAQIDLQTKFEKVIESLTKEIAKKQEANNLLEKEVADIRQELKESKQDLSTIVAYLAKRKNKGKQAEARRTLLNSEKLSGNIEKSVSGSRGAIDISGKEECANGKPRSPRTQILKKTYKI